MSEQRSDTSGPSRPSAMGRLWTFLRILNVRLRFIFLMVLVGLVAGHWDDIMNRYDRWQRPPRAARAVVAEESEYYCPMHPNIVRADPGNCPICGMPLSKRARTGKQELPEGVLARVQLTPWRIQLGRIATTPVGYHLLSREIRTVGVVDYDETRRAFIAARIRGRIDQLMVNYVGQHVDKGDPLVSLYSPDLLVAQRELIEAVTSLRQQAAGPGAAGAQSLVEAARRRLLLWGITEEQVDEIARRGTPETHLTLYSPVAGIVTEKKVLEGHYVNEGDDLYTVADLSRVWMQAKVFEDQFSDVKIGQAVEVSSTAYPSEIFAGRIAFIAYTVDAATRTIAARVEVNNPDYKLRPGMYVTAAIRLPAGEVTEIEPPAAVPAGSAPADAETATHLEKLTRAYLALASAYAADATDPNAAADLTNQARALADDVHGALRGAAGSIAELAGKLAGKELKAQRTMFAELSSRVIEMVRAHPPAGLTLYIAHCPMVNADWLQTSQPIRNPYYGSEMLTCGSITGELKPGAIQMDERFAMGYFCPIYPDRLYDKPQHCPIDGFPLKYAKVEKVLAVPESAVIDTGTRQVVYRESQPGAFDLAAVKLGPRAGEFYPVLAGLEAGDRVVTVGTFLVDAENRLNPAAAAQYFGASGGPQGSAHPQ